MERRLRLRSMSIKARLRAFFGSVVCVMLLGSLLSFWQFRNVSGYVDRVTMAERRLTTLLRLNSGLITLTSRLNRTAENQDPHQFRHEASALTADFQKHSETYRLDLQRIAHESDRHAVLVESILAIIDDLPARVSSLVNLADTGDWSAVQARLLNQADRTDDVVAALMQQADADLASARKRVTEDLEYAQKQAVRVLAITAGLSFLVAGVLGAVVARRIIKPLSELDQATRALSAGDFDHRVPVHGQDELAHLAEAFNRTAAELSRLFEEVRRERLNAEAAHAALKQRAQELARVNADLQQFAYSASHDLQEPLRIVSLYSQLLHRKYSGHLDETGEEYLGYIRRSAGHQEQLIRDLLAYTQTTSDGVNADNITDCNAVFERVVHTLELQIRDHACHITSGPLPSVRVHEVHVQQVLQNLIANAIRYRSEAPPEIRITADRQNDLCLFSVSDNGIGIDPQYARQIFGIFKRLHGSKYPGTGIGLAICQKIVEGYGGSIWVESQAGQGATFRFTLPAA